MYHLKLNSIIILVLLISTALLADNASSVAPEQAVTWLKNGNTRFMRGSLRKDGQSLRDVLRLKSAQSPHSIILSCSDSRVPPEILFDQKLGEIFVVRSAGHTLDDSSIASIEYAVEHLKVKNIIVMGHSSCGAVQAAFSTLQGQDAGSPALNSLVDRIHPFIKKYSNQKPSKDFEVEAWSNVAGVSEELAYKSKIISEKLEVGEIKINGALYHLDTGRVEFRD